MLRRRPGTYVVGEMLDGEAPTGGYLLQACFATGRAAWKDGVGRLYPEDLLRRVTKLVDDYRAGSAGAR